MKAKIAIAATALVLGTGGIAYAESKHDATLDMDKGKNCLEVSADGTSSLHVSERALKLLRENDWEATSDDGLVCK